MKNRLKNLLVFSVVIAVLFAMKPFCVLATGDDTSSDKYYLGTDSLVNAGKDTGYADSNLLDKKDPHWDWQLGHFYVNGYTRVSDLNGNPLFLKNVGDTVTLWFDLVQNIDCLNGDEKLVINEDTDGWDKNLGITQQNFGRGMLIVKHTDYQNNTKITTYQDFLSAKASTTAATQVQLFEEGDYEIALDYEIKKTNLDVFGWNPFPSYLNYRITFKFSVRNGNCMVFPFDVKTKMELTNTSITENGFYLDLAKSRYLDIDIKKEILAPGAEGLTEDTRFNKPAKDGNQYTDEGIYTITVSNRYTNRETTKIIYVGTNNVLKAHIVTGLSIQDINRQIAAGATITNDGYIIPAAAINTEITTSATASSTASFVAESSDVAPDLKSAFFSNDLIVPVAIVALVLVTIISIIAATKRRK